MRAHEARTADLVLAAGAALVVACLLWWTYFGWLKEATEHGFEEVAPELLGPTARDAYSLGHFPLICGIIGFAAAVEEIVLHPGEPAPTPVVAALAVGIALFVGSSAFAYWRTTGEVLRARLGIIALIIVAVAVAASANPVWPLVAVAVGLAAIVAVEHGRERRAPVDVLDVE